MFLYAYSLFKTNKKYKEGFYVYGPKVTKTFNLKTAQGVTNYIARYASHPAISESRILSMDTEENTITWFYDPHEDDNIKDKAFKKGRQTVTDNVFDFMIKLVRHIPDKGVHLIRYYGFYANKSTKKIGSFEKILSKASISLAKSKLKFRSMIKSSYKFDPCLCHCGFFMNLNYEQSSLPNSRKRGFTSDA